VNNEHIISRTLPKDNWSGERHKEQGTRLKKENPEFKFQDTRHKPIGNNKLKTKKPKTKQ
jgi:hypothetical protein